MPLQLRKGTGYFALLALAAAGRAQPFADPGVVRGEPVVVAAAPLPSQAEGASRLAWDPATNAPLGAWQELQDTAANFHVSDAGSGGFGSLFAVRGVANTPYFSDPAVTVYLGDIPLPSSFAYPSELTGFDSATLVRGPVGTEFGRATDGGVVLFTPAPRNQAMVGAGSQDERRGSLETIAGGAFVAAGYEARNGYIQNAQLGRRVDDREGESAYAQATQALGRAVRATVEGWAARSRAGAEPLVPLGGPFFTVSRAAEGVTDLDSWAAAARIDAALPDGTTLRAVTSITDWRMNPFRNFLVLPPPLLSTIVQDQKSVNEELHVSLPPVGPVRLDGGAWLSRATTDNAVDRAIPGKFPIEISSFGERSDQGAVFGEAVATLASGWSATAGLRAEATVRHFSRQEQAPVPHLGYVGEGRYAALLPRIALAWTGPDDNQVQAAVAWGLRPGGFASYTDNPADIPFASERMTEASLGWNRGLAGGAVRVAARLFHQQISNYQIERSFSASDYFVATAPRASADGGELEVTWHLQPHWTVAGSAGATRAVLNRYFSPFTGADLSGYAAPYIPRYTGSIDVSWRGNAGWFAGARVVALGRTNYDDQATSRYSQAAYALLAARAGWQGPRWTIALYGENLTGRNYAEAIIPGVNSLAPGAPRRGGGDVSFRW